MTALDCVVEVDRGIQSFTFYTYARGVATEHGSAFPFSPSELEHVGCVAPLTPLPESNPCKESVSMSYNDPSSSPVGALLDKATGAIQAATRPLQQTVDGLRSDLAREKAQAQGERLEHRRVTEQLHAQLNQLTNRLASSARRNQGAQAELTEKFVVIGRLNDKLKAANGQLDLKSLELVALLKQRDEYRRLYEERLTPLNRAAKVLTACGATVKGGAAKAATLPRLAARVTGAAARRSWQATRLTAALMLGAALLAGGLTVAAGARGLPAAYERYLLTQAAPVAPDASNPREQAWLAQRAAQAANVAQPVLDAASNRVTALRRAVPFGPKADANNNR